MEAKIHFKVETMDPAMRTPNNDISLLEVLHFWDHLTSALTFGVYLGDYLKTNNMEITK